MLPNLHSFFLHFYQMHKEPSSDTIIIHTDASRDDQVTGIGYRIRGGNISVDDSKYLAGHYTSMEAELHALLEAVRIATVESDCREECVVYVDVEPLVTKICGSQEESGEWGDYRSSAKWLLDKFDSWKIEHIPRSENESAHDLAQSAFDYGRQRIK